MNHREKAFRTKFEHAARQLGTVPEQVVSLKLRNHVGSYHEYGELLSALTHEAGVKSTPADGNLQGNGHIVENSKTRIIVVEHETGLEILYIAGSIASLLGLIPLVLKCWTAIRGFMGHPHRRPVGPVEIRRLGENGKLMEDRSHGLTIPWEHSLGAVDNALLLAAENLDAELHELRETVRALTGRVVALEGASRNKRAARKTRPKKRSK